jgi:hypothetical protein
MKKIKLFIVTYNAIDDLDKNIRTCIAGEIDKINLQINIINNHTNFHLAEDLTEHITVFHNTLRPDFSTGHLSRSWNQAIINGFKNLKEPDCDILITCQDDAIWDKNWVEKLLSIHEKYDFYTCNNGDMLCSYTVEAIKKIGLWDERFCNIQFQEADYFLRANIYHGDKSSINDSNHHRTLNETSCIVERPTSFSQHTPRAHVSNQFHEFSKNIFIHKWGNMFSWTGKVTNIEHSKLPSFFYYPYFERDIENAKEKGYIVP